jgi:hypothetical protein
MLTRLLTGHPATPRDARISVPSGATIYPLALPHLAQHCHLPVHMHRYPRFGPHEDPRRNHQSPGGELGVPGGRRGADRRDAGRVRRARPGRSMSGAFPFPTRLPVWVKRGHSGARDAPLHLGDMVTSTKRGRCAAPPWCRGLEPWVAGQPSRRPPEPPSWGAPPGWSPGGVIHAVDGCRPRP